MTDGRLAITKDGYEAVELDAARNAFDDVPMQKIVRIAAGASSVPQSLAPNDMDFLVGPDTHCQPCRLIRITSPTPVVRLTFTWSDAAVALNLWVNGRAFLGDAAVREVSVDVPVSAGEAVVYVGKIRSAVVSRVYVGFSVSVAELAAQTRR